ncbi:MAG: DNA repair protein RecN, partial [Ghiorsea sp.]
DYHPALQEAHALLTQMEALAGEISPYLQEALDNQVDVESLAAAEDRLSDVRAAMRRHDCDEQGLMVLIASWEDKLSALDSASWDEEACLAQQQTCIKAYQTAAQAVHQARQVAAEELLAALRPFLDQLGLKNMQLNFSIHAQEDTSSWKKYGWDQISLLAAANPGEPFKRLSDTASGGELSRLVLALKGCGALEHAPATAIFDEIDVGIGGETGWCVGELLRAMGMERQVLVVSHLPQVAASAHAQVAIEKFIHDGRTKTQLTMLEDGARKEEVARMLGGANEESLHHAEQMLTRGNTSNAL